MLEKPLTETGERFLEIRRKAEDAAEKSGRSRKDITVMAVTKTVPPEKINEAIEAGCVLLGENRVQEFLGKYEQYDKRAEVHFIGTLQTNKVKYIADKVTMIESVDSVKLAEEIGRQCGKIGKIMDILLEVNIAKEESKGGFLPEEVVSAAEEIAKIDNIKLRGLMTIGRFGADFEETGSYFENLKLLLVDINNKILDNRDINVLSMGMSSDYEVAAAKGATIVRVGRGLFGERK